ncbi:MAG: hypothetical protein QOG20_505 [Pseudonocardiales bacterium]|nr:hypothetical protein [Pseudonocardiales bacterium]
MVRFSVSSSRRPATAWAQMRRSKGSRVQVRSVAAPTTSENGVVLTVRPTARPRAASTTLAGPSVRPTSYSRSSSIATIGETMSGSVSIRWRAVGENASS